MDRLLRFSLSFLFLISFNKMTSQQYEMIWHDEFQNPGKPDPEKWSYETGFIRNLEEQIYTRRKKNIRIKNGILEIIARKERYKNKRYAPHIKNYRFNRASSEFTSGSIHTKNKFEFKYGRIEVRAKLPSGNGVWPAIWMLGANFDEVKYPRAGEIDLMEHVGISPGEVHATVHYPMENNQGITSNGGSQMVKSLSSEFHTYAMNWSTEKIEFLIDNEPYHSFVIDQAGTDNNPFRKPFYLILNLALGGNWAGKVDPDIFPQKFLIDYVRVYKQVGK